jgi:hypothetical protein
MAYIKRAGESGLQTTFTNAKVSAWAPGSPLTINTGQPFAVYACILTYINATTPLVVTGGLFSLNEALTANQLLFAFLGAPGYTLNNNDALTFSTGTKATNENYTYRTNVGFDLVTAGPVTSGDGELRAYLFGVYL